MLLIGGGDEEMGRSIALYRPRDRRLFTFRCGDIKLEYHLEPKQKWALQEMDEENNIYELWGESYRIHLKMGKEDLNKYFKKQW